MNTDKPTNLSVGVDGSMNQYKMGKLKAKKTLAV